MSFERFNTHLRPQDGRFFVDEDGVKHRGDQWEHVAVRLAAYRKRAGKSPGNPHAEIEAQVCARHPDYCIKELRPPVSYPRERENPGQMTKRIMRWLANILKLRRSGKAQKVSREEAYRRAEICARCPQQRKMSSVCGACNATRKSSAELLLGGDRRINKELGGCRILDEDTSISVHIEQAPVTNPGLPENCWRK